MDASDGTEIGAVVSVTDDQLDVKRKGLFGGHVQFPRSMVAEVEGRRVELEPVAGHPR